MRFRMLLTVPTVLVFGIANAQIQPDYSRDTIRVTAQWSHQPESPVTPRTHETRIAQRATVVSASPIAQLAMLPASIAHLFAGNTANTVEPMAADEAGEENVPFAQNLLSYARRYLSTRYRSGGTTPGGFDCSGFVRYCFTKFGVQLPHSSAAQADLGAKIDREFARPGDLIFFNGHASGGARVGHVGIITEVVNNQVRFIHSANGGGVKFDFLRADYYRKRFVTIRRMAHLVAQN